MNYKSIKEEAKLCRAAFKGAKVGDLVWFCHHEIPIEILTEPPKNRIKFILSNKAQAEQAIRLHWFRPCKIELPPELDAARSKLDAACSEWNAASSVWDTASSNLDALDATESNLDAVYSKLDAARSKLDEAYFVWDAAHFAWDIARFKYADEINTLIKLHLPGCPWDGYTLFPEENPK